jgi:DNA polymerase-3 subunit epsilon
VRRPTLFRTPTSPAAKLYARAPVEAGKTPWRKAHYCVVDLELSGLDQRNDEIISFAAVPIDAGRVVAGSALYGLCRPTRPLTEQSVLIHGIRTVDLADAPPFDEAIRPLITAMAGRVLVVHVAWVERSFLGRAFASQGLHLRGPILDTCELGKLLALTRHQPPAPRALDELARSLYLPVHRPHHALGDALTTAQVFLALATHLEEFIPETVQSLARANQRLSSYRV